MGMRNAGEEVQCKLTTRGARDFVLDDVDLVSESELLEQVEELSFGHMLRHLADEELDAVLAFRLRLLRH